MRYAVMIVFRDRLSFSSLPLAMYLYTDTAVYYQIGGYSQPSQPLAPSDQVDSDTFQQDYTNRLEANNGAADLAYWPCQWQGTLLCCPACHGKQMYILVVGSLLADEAHNYFMRVFVYCSPLLASTLAPDKFLSRRCSAS